MRKKEAGLTAMLRSLASHDVSRKYQYRAHAVVAHFLIGGPNSLCGQSRERGGNLPDCDVTIGTFSEPSVSAFIFSKAEKNTQGLV